MTKKRRVPIKLAVADGEDTENEEGTEADESRPRPAPNTNFLGRLVRGVATGNQRQMDATTSNAANLSIGATGAASLRLQLQRTRSARFQTLRRVVLSSAEQQRITLCTALLAEVAQGFGFRLTVRQPDGQEVGARQAMAAVAHLNPDATAPAAEDAEAEAAGAAVAGTAAAGDNEAGAASDPTRGPAGSCGGDGNSAGAGPEAGISAEEAVRAGAGDESGAELPDFLDSLTPLDVELHLGPGGAEGLLAAKESVRSLVGAGLAARLARSPSGLRPAQRPGSLKALLSGRLTSAALGSIGLVGGPRKTAAAQAVQAAKRRFLMRAASNAAAEAAAQSGTAAADPAPDADAAGGSAPPAAAPADAAAAGSSSGRRIVWDPSKLARPSTTPPLKVPLPAIATATAKSTPGDIASAAAVVAPPAKRARTSPAAAATAIASAATAAAGLDGAHGASGADVPMADAVAMQAGPTADADMELESGGKRAGQGQVAGARAGASAGGVDGSELVLEAEQHVGGRGDSEVEDPDPEEALDFSGEGEADGGGAADGLPAGHRGSGDEEDVKGSGGDPAAAEQGAAAVGDRLAKAVKRREASAAAAKDSEAVGRSSRLLGAALARTAAPTSVIRSRAPITVGTGGGSGGGGGGASRTVGSAAAPAAAAASEDGDTEDADTAREVMGTEADHADLAGKAAPAQQRPGGAGAGRGVGSGATGKAAGAGPLVSPAGKLFSAAVRQLQRRSKG